MIRRLVFLAVFIPVLLYGFGQWIVNGKNPNDLLDRLLLWMDEA